MLDFAQNFNSIPFDGIDECVRHHADFVYRYPDYRHEVIKKALSDAFHVPPESFGIGAGATEIIFLLPRIFRRECSVIVYPTFWEYEQAALRVDQQCVREFFTTEEANFSLDGAAVSRMLATVPSAMIYLCNPNSPTSVLTEKHVLLELIEAHSSIDFVVDETYLLFREDFEQQSLLSDVVRLSNLTVVSSLSKMFSLPGLRIGLLVAHPKVIAAYDRLTIPYATNPLAEALIPLVLGDTNAIAENRRINTMLRARTFDEYRSALSGRVKIFKPDANFMLLKLPSGIISTAVVRSMAEQGILIRDGVGFKGLGEQWLRIGIRSMEDNQICLSALQSTL